MSDHDFTAYIALKRLRTELWRSLPPLVFIRWMFREKPRMVIPFAICVWLVALVTIAADVVFKIA